MQGPEVRSGDLPQPIKLEKGDEFTFTIKRGVGTDKCVSVNYDDFVNDVDQEDIILIDGQSSFSNAEHRIEATLKEIYFCKHVSGTTSVPASRSFVEISS